MSYVSASEVEKKILRKIIAGGLSRKFEFPGALISGGAVRDIFLREMPKDIDYYFKTELDFRDAVENMFKDRAQCVFASKKAVTFNHRGLTIQLMHFDWFPVADKIFDSFDFTCCMGAYDVDTGQFVLHDDFMPSLVKRELIFNPNCRYPLSTLLRIHKFLKRGFGISKGELTKFALASSGVQINDWKGLEEQMSGFYGERLAALDKSQPFSLQTVYKAIDDCSHMTLKGYRTADIGDPEDIFVTVDIGKDASNGPEGIIPLAADGSGDQGYRWPESAQEVFKYCL